MGRKPTKVETISYKRIENQRRYELVHLVRDEKMKLKYAAKKLEINYSTAKTIMRLFRLEKRFERKTKYAMRKLPNKPRRKEIKLKPVRKQSTLDSEEFVGESVKEKENIDIEIEEKNVI